MNKKLAEKITGNKVISISKEYKHDFKVEKVMNEIIRKSANALAEQIDDKMRPMITEALYRLNYVEHRQQKGMVILDNDNSIMAKDIIKIMRDIFILFRNSDGERIKKKYKHKKY